MTKWFLNLDFGGRARRSHYWANLGAWIGVFALLLAISAAAGLGRASTPANGGAVGSGVALLFFLAAIAACFDGMAMVFRRAHDTGKSGWVWLLLLVPIVNLLPLYWLMIQDSDQGPNKYGAPVKQFYDPTRDGVSAT